MWSKIQVRENNVNVRFANRKDWETASSSYICVKHFEEKYYKKGKNSTHDRLAINMKPVVTIFDPKKVSEIKNVMLPISIPWRIPRKSLYQEDQ